MINGVIIFVIMAGAFTGLCIVTAIIEHIENKREKERQKRIAARIRAERRNKIGF